MKTHSMSRWSAIAYLFIFFFGFLANFMILEQLYVANDAALTALSMRENLKLYAIGYVSFWIIIFVDIFLVYSLYKVFKSVSKRLSFLASLLRALYVLVFIYAMGSLTDLFCILVEGDWSSENFVNQANALTRLVNEFQFVWTIGLSIFGMHLIALSVLVCKSKDFRKGVAYFLCAAGASYILDGLVVSIEVLNFLQPISEVIVLSVAVLGEFGFLMALFGLFRKSKLLRSGI